MFSSVLDSSWDPIKAVFWASWILVSFFFFGLFGGGCIGLYTLNRFFGVSLYMKFSLLIKKKKVCWTVLLTVSMNIYST